MLVRTDQLQDYRAMTYYDGLKNTQQQDFQNFQNTKQQQLKQEARRVEQVAETEKADADAQRLAAEMTGMGQQINIQV